MNKLLTIEQVGEILGGKNRRQVLYWIKKSKVPTKTVGTEVMVEESVLLAVTRGQPIEDIRKPIEQKEEKVKPDEEMEALDRQVELAEKREKLNAANRGLTVDEARQRDTDILAREEAMEQKEADLEENAIANDEEAKETAELKTQLETLRSELKTHEEDLAEWETRVKVAAVQVEAKRVRVEKMLAEANQKSKSNDNMIRAVLNLQALVWDYMDIKPSPFDLFGSKKKARLKILHEELHKWYIDILSMYGVVYRMKSDDGYPTHTWLTREKPANLDDVLETISWGPTVYAKHQEEKRKATEKDETDSD